jgi:hypothetical protein
MKGTLRNTFTVKTVCKLAALIVVAAAVSVYGFSQTTAKQKPATTAQNLVRGVIGPVGSNGDWADYSVLNVVPGSALFPITSSTTVFYFGFTAGSEADISNMVVYTTAHGSLTITAVTPVTYGGVSNPSINLANTSVCPVQPLSTTNPCIVRFDPTTLSLSPASDYYLAVYFTNDSNNGSIAATQPGSLSQTSLICYYTTGNYTDLTVGQSVPGSGNHVPDFLMYVMTD